MALYNIYNEEGSKYSGNLPSEPSSVKSSFHCHICGNATLLDEEEPEKYNFNHPESKYEIRQMKHGDCGCGGFTLKLNEEVFYDDGYSELTIEIIRHEDIY